MVALNFPASPTDGQVYGNWKWSATKVAWQAIPMTGPKTVNSDTAPASPQAGDQWFNTTTGVLYIWVVDVDSAQWVESQAPITANGYYSPNYIINGAFEINQRNFSSTTASGTYGFDRWQLSCSGGTSQVSTYSLQTFTPGTAPTTGYEGKNFARLACTSQVAANDYSSIRQPIEDVRALAGKTVTVSFWAKASTGTPNIGVVLTQEFGTGGSTGTNTNAIVSITSSWARYSKTFTVPSIAGKTIGANDTTALWLFTSVGSSIVSLGYPNIGLQNVTVDFWGIQVEEGNAATAFRRNANSIQGELAACQRYYCKSYDLVTAPGSSTGNGNAMAVVNANATSTADTSSWFPVEMRATPSINVWTPAGTIGNADAFGVGNTAISAIGRVGTRGFGHFEITPARTGGGILMFHYEAKAEL